MKATVKRALVRFRLFGPAVFVYWGLIRLSRAARGADRRIARRYLARIPEPRLHVGCGDHMLDGWLNADSRPCSARVLRMDATRRFPFPDNVFSYVYSEHVIEHLNFGDGAAMLDECFRVLAPGGKIRISTPDLAFLTALHGAERTALQERYLAWAAAGLPGGEAGFVIDAFIRGWGHRFIYDEPILRGALERAGFSDAARRGLNESGDAALRGLANAGRMPEGFLELETLTLEAGKPR